MDWLAFAGSILGGLIGGLFTYFGVRLTLKYEREKEKKELLIKADAEKPRFEIVKYLDFDATKSNKKVNNDCNVLMLNINNFVNDHERAQFFYDEKALKDENLVFVEYELKNTGSTEISDICITGNLPKNLSLIELERKEFYITKKLLNYGVWSNKRYIKPGQTLILRVYYIKEQIIVSNLGTPVLTIWLNDINGRYWSQLLASPSQQIEISRYRKYSEFRESIDIDKAIECFIDPRMW